MNWKQELPEGVKHIIKACQLQQQMREVVKWGLLMPVIEPRQAHRYSRPPLRPRAFHPKHQHFLDRECSCWCNSLCLQAISGHGDLVKSKSNPPAWSELAHSMFTDQPLQTRHVPTSQAIVCNQHVATTDQVCTHQQLPVQEARLQQQQTTQTICVTNMARSKD